MKFEWDNRKAEINLQKHKVSFEEASTSLSDPMAATGPDPDHSTDEFRYIPLLETFWLIVDSTDGTYCLS